MEAEEMMVLMGIEVKSRRPVKSVQLVDQSLRGHQLEVPVNRAQADAGQTAADGPEQLVRGRVPPGLLELFENHFSLAGDV